MARVSGVIIGYRRGTNTQYPDQVLVKLDLEDPRRLGELLSARIIARDPKGNEYKGRILKPHGRRNAIVVARFKPNIPGQMIGSKVWVITAPEAKG